MKDILALLMIATTFAGSLAASDIHELRRSCLQRASLGAVGRHWIEQCAIDIVTLQPVHPVFQTIAPGTGTGFGIGYDRIRRRGRYELIPSAKFLISTNRSLLADGRFTIGLPGLSISQISAPSADSNGEIFYQRRLSLVSGSPEIDAKAGISFYLQRLESQRQDFYGLGPTTTQSDLAFYKSRQTAAGIQLTDPLTTWASVGFTLDYLNPKIAPVLEADRPAITHKYTETTVPGVENQPDFLRFGPEARFRFDPTLLEFFDLTAGYVFYHDLDSHRYSFRQFEATSQIGYEMLIQTQNTASNRSALSNFFCSPRPAKECSLGTLAFSAQVVLSQVDSTSQVPFYFQPTLGGTDLQGQDTLRGYRDFRFRGPNLMLFQAEYRPGIWGPVGFFSFADIGRVALRPSELAFENLRHDIGLGLYFSAGDHILLRAFVGFGTREGVRPNAKLAGGSF